ncbi:hypothetical protein Q3G72_016176 [Acer saccharum]|nr:hypothetical protein Q3G72_016176 [Acer saccharum]
MEGNRKFTARIWTRIVVLSANLSQADSEDHSSKQNNVVQAFWAPFLLLHLGGPETITSYSLEDNELWLRRFLGLIVQVGVAIYVLIRSWSNTALTYIFIPMLIAGMIKYGERNLVLWSSSSQRFKDSLLSKPDPGPDFIKNKTKMMKRPEMCSRMAANHGQQQPTPRSTDTALPLERLEGSSRRGADYQLQNPTTVTVLPPENLRTGAKNLELAYFLFKRFQYLFADLILSYYERKDSYSKIENKSEKDAFELVAIELGFMYDLLYTKASIVHSQLGVFFRFISLCCCVSALVTLSIIIDSHSYSQIDISITYILLVGAVALEVGATCACHGVLANCKRWSVSMAQYNLIISSCLQKVQPIFIGIHNLPWIGELLDKYWHLTWEDVDDDLQNIIFSQLLEKSNEITVFCPSILPEGIGEIKYRDTHVEALRFFLDEEIFYVEVMKGCSFQHKACKTIAISCFMISEVLVVMLTYAANKCTWKEHSQRLSKSGELLTHVRLFMAHLGLSEQYRIQKCYYDVPQRHYLNLTCSCVCSFL